MQINTKKLKVAGLVVFLVAMLVLAALSARWAISLGNPEKLEEFKDFAASFGVGGWIFVLAIQYVQIVIAFIPGGPIQIVAGALLGPWGGLAVCLSGTFLATITVFWLVSRFGHSIISLLVGKRDIGKYEFLNNESKLELLVLILFFVPGTPKDALTYLFALTKIKMARFMLLSTLARLPAMATSLVAGGSLASGHWVRAVVMFAIMTVISLIGLFIHDKIRRVE